MSGGKKRVSHVGQTYSKKNKIMKDVVADIMLEMSTMESKLPQILKFTPREGSGISSLDCPSTSAQSSIAPLQQKKFLTGKRHPLMEKAQRHKNYIKHNRSMPKPRAHLSRLNDSIDTKKNKKIVSPSFSERAKSFKIRRDKSNFRTSDTILSEESISDDSSKCIKVPKSNFRTKNAILYDENMSDDSSKCSKVPKSNFRTNTILSSEDISDDSSKCSKVADSSSDSESAEFELFLQSQKHSKGKKNHSKKRRIKQYGTKSKPIKRKKYNSDIKLKSSKSKREDRSSPKISSKASATNRLKLDETSDSSVSSDEAENESSNNSFKMKKTPTIPSCQNNIDEEPFVQTEMHNLACSVRIERNPLLDEAAAQLNLPVDDNDSESLCSTKPQENNERSPTKLNDENALDPDDDCMIVCEVPKFNNADNTETDIQILNVVSLGEKGVTDTMEGNSVRQSISEENTCSVDFEKIKEAIEIALKLNISKEQNSNSELFNSNPELVSNTDISSMQTVAERNLNEDSSYVSEGVKKKDLEKILFLANNVNNQVLPDREIFNSLPYSTSIADTNSMSTMNLPACHSIPSDTLENVSKKDLEEILLLANPAGNNEIFPDGKVCNSFPSSSSFTYDIPLIQSTSFTKSEIITGQNVAQDKDSIQSRQDYSDPCDELDILGISSIRDLHRNQSSQNMSNLIHLYNKSQQDYNEIKNSDESRIVGLKMLEKSSAATTKNLLTVFNHLMKSDPCFYSTLKNSLEINRCFEKENASSKPVKKCINCGAMATIVCDKCKKVFFCTTKCGVNYWESIHYKECEGSPLIMETIDII